MPIVNRKVWGGKQIKDGMLVVGFTLYRLARQPTCHL
jgi:hypothetical protein